MLPPPNTFGLPSKFSDWRPGQLDAVHSIIDSNRRFISLCAPTGFGKSLMYFTAAVLTGKRTVILTSTKGLQDQLLSDFGKISSDIRGMSNYSCPKAGSLGYPTYTTVADAPCQSGYKCPIKSGGCNYFDLYRAAQAADIVVTNYQCWMYDQNKRSGLSGLSPVEMLVLDEAHDAPEELSRYLSVEVERSECLALHIVWNASGTSLASWREWAIVWCGDLERRGVSEYERTMKSPNRETLGKLASMRKLYRKLKRLATMEDTWIKEEEPAKRGFGPLSVRFDPLWPRHYAESALFRGCPSVVLVSATVRPKTMELLGISKTSGADFLEFNSSFPVASRPIIHVPTVRLNWENEQNDLLMMQWVRRIDAILAKRKDRNGVIHTVSYRRMRDIVANSHFGSQMLHHESKGRKEVVEKFKASSGSTTGTVLVSPSVDTGYDFPYKECEFQIVGKLPFFPGKLTEVMRARLKADPEYSNYLVAQILTQTVGRGMRAPDDRCETLIIDDSFVWFYEKNQHYFPAWFQEAVIWSKSIPNPLPKL